MLRTLEIRDMLIIDRMELEFQPGLNVLTGETGAGKSILLDALGFVLGWRGRAELVREGAEQGEVTAVFDISDDHPVRDLLADAGLPTEGELILRRVNTRDGRKSAWANNRRVSGEVLRGLSARLVELHGQNDDRGLLNPRGHRALLDDFGGLAAQLSKCRQAWRDMSECRKSLDAQRAELAEIEKEEEFLRHAADELAALDPKPGEEPELDQRRRLMQAGARVGEDVARAAEALGLQAADGQVADATRWIEATGDVAPKEIEAALEALVRTRTELGHAQAAVEALASVLNFDPNELEQVEERLFAIRALARKHNVQPDDLEDFGQNLRAQLDQLEAATDQGGRLEEALNAAQHAYEGAASNLSKARIKAAKKLDKMMEGELKPLKMEAARFTTVVEPCEPGPEGTDMVQFQVATNPGAPAGALNRIASGGELSRFLLALKVCLTAEEAGLSLIFDEIDRGVGGATADAVGRRLARLSDGAQVLVVTHSPQVAALGDHHWRVEKQTDGTSTLSRVIPLDASERVDETARMLAGDRVTDEARANARALLAR